MKLFVAGLPNDFDETDLKEMFELYGEVRSAKLVTDKTTGKSKGFGFVDMPNDIEAQETIEVLNDASIKGKKIAVKQAEDRPGGAGPSRGGGGFNRGGGGGFNRGGGGGYDRGGGGYNRGGGGFNRR